MDFEMIYFLLIAKLMAFLTFLLSRGFDIELQTIEPKERMGFLKKEITVFI